MRYFSRFSVSASCLSWRSYFLLFRSRAVFTICLKSAERWRIRVILFSFHKSSGVLRLWKGGFLFCTVERNFHYNHRIYFYPHVHCPAHYFPYYTLLAEPLKIPPVHHFIHNTWRENTGHNIFHNIVKISPQMCKLRFGQAIGRCLAVNWCKMTYFLSTDRAYPSNDE